MLTTYIVGLCYDLVRQGAPALDSYRTCKWFYEQERRIFAAVPTTPLQNFLCESCKEEQTRLTAVLAEAGDTRKKVEVVKSNPLLNTSQIRTHIDSMWPRPLVNRKKTITQAARTGNFCSILTLIHNPMAIIPRTQLNPSSSQKKALSSLPSPTGEKAQSARPGRSARLKKPSRFLSAEEATDRDKKMLNPDEYFKTRICKDLQISCDWLEESDPKRRFRQDMIEDIKKREKNSHRSLKILRDFLMVKRRDKSLTEAPETDPKVLQQQAYYDVGHRMYTLKSTVLPSSPQPLVSFRKKKPHSHFANSCASLDTPRGSAKSQHGGSFIAQPPRLRLASSHQLGKSQDGSLNTQESKKQLTLAAEELQREIQQLEKAVLDKKTSSTSRLLMKPTNRKTNEMIEHELMKHQNLADSVVMRAKKVLAAHSAIIAKNSTRTLPRARLSQFGFPQFQS